MAKKIALAIVLSLIPIMVTAQITDFKAESYQDEDGNELNYRILKPAEYDTSKSYPLVLFLHGAGERGSDNFSQLKWGVNRLADPEMREEYPAFVVAPQVPEEEWWSNLRTEKGDTTTYTVPLRENPTEPMRLTIELLDKLEKEYAIDKDRIYITGLSMGGYGTFDLLVRYPEKFAAAAPICGGGDLTRAFLLEKTPLWIFHGAQDEVVDVRYSREMVEAIRLAGGSPGYTEYPHADHVGAFVKAYRDPELYKWLFSKELDR